MIRIKLIYSIIIILLFNFPLSAQYYYKDIIVPAQTNASQRQFALNNIHKIQLKSFEADRTITPGFNCYQTISADFKVLTTYTSSSLLTNSVMTSRFDATGRLIAVTDSSKDGSTHTGYHYNNKGELETLSVRVTGKDVVDKQETHSWFYNARSKPDYMLKTTNGKDTVKTTFTLDEQDRVSIEKTVFSAFKATITYYYYNDHGQLTDIVKFNPKANRLLPEQMFEYTEAGALAKNVQVNGEGSNYVTWTYVYNDAGLKVKEIATDKYKQLLGWIELSY